MARSHSRAFRVGPFRLVFSKAGVESSTVMKGWRGGARKGGLWISVKAAGAHYWRFSPQAAGASPVPTTVPNSEEIKAAIERQGLRGALQQWGAAEFTECPADALSQEWSARQSKVISLKAAMWISLAILALGLFIASFTTILGVVVLWIFRDWQKRRASLAVWYDLDPEMEHRWEDLRKSLLSLSQARGFWRLESTSQVSDPRYSAGADHVIKRQSAQSSAGTPPYLCSNCTPITLVAGQQSLRFFPDQLWAQKGLAIVSSTYKELDASAAQTKFVEGEKVPSDAKVLGTTWKHANKNGTPARRFAHNQAIPICEYELLTLQSGATFRQQYYLSCAVSEPVIGALRRLGSQPAAVSPVRVTTRPAKAKISPTVTQRSSAIPPLPGAELQTEVKVASGVAAKARGEKIPRRAEPVKQEIAPPAFHLDMSRVQALTAETHEVIALLSAVMDEGDAPAIQVSSPTPLPPEASPPWMVGLPDRYHKSLLHLMEHDEVTLQRFDAIAVDHHLLPDDLLTSVNAWSDEYLGDFLLERGDAVRICRELVAAKRAA